MSTQTMLKRSITELTPAECQALLGVAIDDYAHAPTGDALDVSRIHGRISFGDDHYGMTLGSDGTVLAWRTTEEKAVMINIRKLICTLDALNVAFGVIYQPTQQAVTQYHYKVQRPG